MQQRTIIIGGIVLLILIVGVVWYVGREPFDPQRLTVPGAPEQVVNEEQFLEFTYYGGWEGYTLLESAPNTAFGDPLLAKAYTIVDTERYDENDRSTEGIGNQIPAISILVFNEPERATTTQATSTGTTTDTEAPEPTLREWAEAHSGFTAYGLRAGEPEDTDVDGARAIRYRAEGPFPSEVYVVDYRDKYYVLIGQYENEDDMIRTAFQKLLSQIFFL